MDEKAQLTVVSRVGDVCAEVHGGGAIVRDADGYLWLEYTYGFNPEYPSEQGTDDEIAHLTDDEIAHLTMELFRVRLDESAWSALSGCGDETKLWTEVSVTVGMDSDELIALAQSDEPQKTAGAFEAFASHWGWRELDFEPLMLTYAEISTRWEVQR